MPRKKISPQPQTDKPRGEVPPTEELEPLEPNTLIIENEALRRGFTIIPNYILRNPGLSTGARLTYTLLLSYAWQEGSCFPGQGRLASDLGVQPRQIRRHLTELKQAGFIRVRRRGQGKTNIYTLVDVKSSDRTFMTGQDRTSIAGLDRQNMTAKEYSVEENTVENNVVVTQLIKFKIAKEKARELAARFSPDYIKGKIEFLEWKLEATTGNVGRKVKDPAAWLIRAIEKDYQPPPAFKNRAQREQEAKELTRAIEEQEKQQQQRREQEERRRQKALAWLKERYGTTQAELALWKNVLREIELTTTKATYQTWFPQTQLLSLKDGVAVIGVPSPAAQEWLGRRLEKVIKKTLEGVAGQSLENLQFEVLQPPHESGE